MIEFTPNECATMDAHKNNLISKFDEISQLVKEFNEESEKYNSFRFEILTKINNEIKEKPPKWHQSSEFLLVKKWFDNWGCMYVGPIDIDFDCFEEMHDLKNSKYSPSISENQEENQ